MKNKKNIVFLIFIILILISSVFIFLLKQDKKNINNIKEEKSKNGASDKWYIPNGNISKLVFYYNFFDGNIAISSQEEDTFNNDLNYKILGTYNCSTSSCKGFGIDLLDNKVIVEDGKYLIYDYKKNKAYDLNLPNANYSSIEFLSYGGKNYGLSVANIKGLYAFYSLKQETFTTEFKYSNIFTSEKAGLLNGYISVALNDKDKVKYCLVSYKDGNVIKDSDFYLGSFGNGKKVYYYENFEMENGYEVIIYDGNFNAILGDDKFNLFSVTESGNLVVAKNDENSFNVYNKTGKLVKRSKDYKYVSALLKDYAVVIDNDDYLKITDIDGNVVSKCMKMDDTTVLDKKLTDIKKENNEEGIFARVVKENNKYYECFYMFDSKEKGVYEVSY